MDAAGIQHFSPSHYVPNNPPPDGAAATSIPARQAISAPQTPVFAEYFVIPKDSAVTANLPNGGINPNPVAGSALAQMTPVQTYPATNLPTNNPNQTFINNAFAMQSRPLIYQPASAPGLLYPQTGLNNSADGKKRGSASGGNNRGSFCDAFCSHLSLGFSKSFENLAYGDQENGDSPGGENHSFRVFAEETTMHGIK